LSKIMVAPKLKGNQGASGSCQGRVKAEARAAFRLCKCLLIYIDVWHSSKTI
jgi:hypothetical protein